MGNIYCKECDLYKNCINQTQVTGNSLGTVLWLLDIPTKEEDITGKCGAGILAIVEAICEAVGTDFNECLFKNIVRCRPAVKRAGARVDATSEAILKCMTYTQNIINLPTIEYAILCGSAVDKYYKSRIAVPHITIVDPILIKDAGGFTSNIYIDTINKVRRWKYENNIE